MDKGIVLYNIELNGCLNGVYTNDSVKGEIYNEIARLKTKLEGDEICGIYHCFYFDKSPVRNDYELKITGIQRLKGIYEYTFEWTELKSSLKIFLGTGYKMNKRQIAVHYKSIS